MKKIAFVFFLLLSTVNLAYADNEVIKGPVSVYKGFINGEDFLKLSFTEKSSYCMGIIDGYLASPMFGANTKYTRWISSCAKGKTNTQISAILEKYLKDNPGRWEKSVQFLMFEALKKACNEN